MAEEAKASVHLCDQAARREAECSQRELACELLLENETRRIQEQYTQMKQGMERERQEFRNQCELKDLKIRELSSRLDAAVLQKALAEEKLHQQIQATSDERLFDAFLKLKELVSVEQSKMKKMRTNMSELIANQETDQNSLVQKEKMLQESQSLLKEYRSQSDELQVKKQKLELELSCLKEANTSLLADLTLAKNEISLQNQRTAGLIQEIETVSRQYQ